MRGLYWLTAVTLVAAAVTTVAIADYGRRHPQTAAAWWNATAQSTTPVVRTAPVRVADVISPSTHTIPPPSLADIKPAIPPVTLPTRVEDVPEHAQLREAALSSLASTSLEVPVLPPASPKTPVVDEFTYSDKPLAPLYVPIQPEAKVVLPPASVLKEVSKLPNIPGVSLNQSGVGSPLQLGNASKKQFESMPDYRTKTGPEVLPGLHAARPETREDDNPVMDTMLAFGELMAAMNPATYLLAVPMDKKAVKAPTQFAAEVKPVTTAPCQDRCCPETPVTAKICVKDNCCTPLTPDDQVIVRTYSVADFTTSAGANHEDLVRLITTMVAPDSWQTRDSNVEYFAQGKCLVIRHRSCVQDQVEDLLSQLRGQVQKQGKSLSMVPSIRHEPTTVVPVDLELVTLAPHQCSERLPRVITNEPARCTDEAFENTIPLRADGRLMPVPMTALEASSLVPAQFQPKVAEAQLVVEGQALTKPRAPEFFPWFLPYAPLPQGPEHCEEELLKRVGFVSYSDDEIAFLFLTACEWEECR